MPTVVLCHQPTDGGVGRHVRDLADGLSACGWTVLLVGPAMPAGVGAATAHVRLDMERAMAPRADLAAGRRLSEIIRRHRPDLVHAHSSKAGAVARLTRLAHPRVPVIYTPHGFAFAGYFARHGDRLLYRLAETALTPLSDRIVCVCEAEAKLARAVGGGRRVRVVHNGVAPAGEGPADPRLRELSSSGPVVGALTLLRPGKGLETLIDAMPQVIARHPGAQLAIYGDGPDRQALQRRAAALGLGGAVHLLGGTDRPLEALRGFEVLAHPSWAESFPYVILEAMSLGVPIVASDVGGIPEALAGGDNGALVPARDPRSLADALSDLLADPLRRQHLAANGREAAAHRYSTEAMIQKLIAVYDELTPRPPSGAACAGRNRNRKAEAQCS